MRQSSGAVSNADHAAATASSNGKTAPAAAAPRTSATSCKGVPATVIGERCWRNGGTRSSRESGADGRRHGIYYVKDGMNGLVERTR